MSDLLKYAETELKAAGYYKKAKTSGGSTENKYKKAVAEAVLALIKLFSEQGHSGLSASVTIDIFNRLARFEPLGPLTGKRDEWNKVADDLWQNKRCSRVFKNEKGEAWDIDGKVFININGVSYTNHRSKVPVTFPYTPKTKYVKTRRK